MLLIPSFQFETLVCEQLESSGLDVTEQLQQLLLSVAEEQADGNIVYSDAIVDAGSALFYPIQLEIFLAHLLHFAVTFQCLAPLSFLNSFFPSSAIRVHGHRIAVEGNGCLKRYARSCVKLPIKDVALVAF
jgi:hypothetical protein